MIVEELNRFDRTLAILVLLQSRKLVKAQDLSHRFGVSLRTIYRDIRSLEAAGVPILGEAGVGYSIMEGYRLPPVMFTREEAGSFVAAEKLMLQFTDAGLGAYFKSAMDKIKSVLKGSEKDWITVLEKGVWTATGYEPFNNNAIVNVLPILFNSIALQQQVHMTYRSLSSAEPQNRLIEPVGVFYENNRWYLYAYCHLRNDYRQFRTDRILAIKPTEKPFSKSHNNIGNLKKEKADCIKTKVVIAVHKKAAQYISEGRKYYGFTEEKEYGHEMHMTFMTTSMEGLARWYLMFGDQARILEPVELKLKVKELAEKALMHLND